MQVHPSTNARSPTRSDPIGLSHGTGVSSEIVSLVTVDVNLVERLTAYGLDVFIAEPCMSPAVPEVVSIQSDTFDVDSIAIKDVPAKVADACAHFA